MGERDMLTARIRPCLDVKDGRVVKGVQFAGLQDAGSPVELAALYEAQGADELVVLDVSATLEERRHAIETIQAIRAVLSIPLSVGGGVKSIEDAEALLDAGADKVCVNSAAVENKSLLRELQQRFGAQCTVLSLDATETSEGEWEVLTNSGKTRTGLSAAQWAKQAEEYGAGELLLTSLDRDGTRSGYDLKLIAAMREIVSVPIIASGGASGPGDLLDAFRAGADAVLAASIFHYKQDTVGSLKTFLETNGVRVRK